MNGILVEHLTKTYGRRVGRFTAPALVDVNLSVSRGETLGVIGPNGAGKTTLLGCLLGFLRPDAGRVVIDGLKPREAIARLGIGYMPERIACDRWMTGVEFLIYHHALARLPASSRRDDVAASLQLAGLADAARRPLARFSLGMLQRLALVQALLGRPRYVFLDDPASGTDPEGCALIRGVIANLKERGTTVILISHQIDEVEQVCDRIALVRTGHVEAIQKSVAVSELSRTLRIRARCDLLDRAMDHQLLTAVASRVQAVLIETRNREARFRINDDDGAARLLAALVANGVPVIEATSEGRGFGQFFTYPGRSEAH